MRAARPRVPSDGVPTPFGPRAAEREAPIWPQGQVIVFAACPPRCGRGLSRSWQAEGLPPSACRSAPPVASRPRLAAFSPQSHSATLDTLLKLADALT